MEKLSLGKWLELFAKAAKLKLKMDALSTIASNATIWRKEGPERKTIVWNATRSIMALRSEICRAQKRLKMILTFFKLISWISWRKEKANQVESSLMSKEISWCLQIWWKSTTLKSPTQGVYSLNGATTLKWENGKSFTWILSLGEGHKASMR